MVRAVTRDGGIDGENKRRIARVFRPLKAARRDLFSADEIELEPARPFRGGPDFLQVRSRQRGERTDGPGLTDGLGRHRLAAGPDHPGAADGSRDHRQVDLVSENLRAQLHRL